MSPIRARASTAARARAHSDDRRIGLIHIRDESLGVIDVVAPEAAMAKARSILDRYDNPAEAQCAVQVTVPHVP